MYFLATRVIYKYITCTGSDNLSVEELNHFAFGQDLPPKLDDDWFPYESKAMFLLDILDNLPRNRLSDSVLKMIIWMLQELGVRDVPSLYAFRKMQNRIRGHGGVPTHPYISPIGNHYFMNDIPTMIAHDWSNPKTRPHIQIYPEISNGPISEFWHAQKLLHDIDPTLLTPMYVRGVQHFYIHEPAQLFTGNFVIPLRWIIYQKVLHAQAYSVTVNSQTNEARISTKESDMQMISVTSLKFNYLDLVTSNRLPKFNSKFHKLFYLDIFSDYLDSPTILQMPNPLRQLAEGEPLYSSFVDLFGDDVSGNRSKSWNKHNNIYMSHRNLPRAMLQQEYHIHFVSTSPHASVTEQGGAVKEQIEKTQHTPIRVWDPLDARYIRFRVIPNAKPGDNPMQNEECSHMLGNSNSFCRKCYTGGSKAEKISDDGYHSLFLPGRPRFATETLREIIRQVSKACTGVEKHVKDRQTSTGVKDIFTQVWIDRLISQARSLKASGNSDQDVYSQLMDWVSEHYDQVFSANLRLNGFDANKDTPVELLHTILLGIVKYVWYSTHTSWSPSAKTLYSQRLQATDIHGLSIPPIRANYIMQFANSLIGRQLKIVAQVSVFHVHDLVSPEIFSIWKAVGFLTALLWLPEIDNTDQYVMDLQQAADNVLDLFALYEPSKIIDKFKLHLLTHLTDDVVRFGPLLGESTEVYECYNAIFRMCSIYSNHLAPSRDIAKQLAGLEDIKHRILGGWWSDTNQNWVQAGAGVRNYLAKHSSLQKIFGWTTRTAYLEPIPRNTDGSQNKTATHPNKLWQETAASQSINADSINLSPTQQWFMCKSVIISSGDRCLLGSWVLAHDIQNNQMAPANIYGRIIEIISDIHGQCSLITLQKFELASDRHPLYDMPKLYQRFSEQLTIVLSAESVQFTFNVQHDCQKAGCTTSGSRPLVQERAQTSRFEAYIEHTQDTNIPDEYIINLHALHNAHLIRRHLPRHLTIPNPLYSSSQARCAEHNKLANQLRVNMEVAAKRKRARADTTSVQAGMYL
ncbi:hypothetical protein K488DRAFT_54332 [Vararia minispora EC-137]|uniref:Uncharacterized protein n=1 Tax=Vararia minispora EC-137 TaxID=1314806 RepID=A0ACB8QFM3_9AGAM|nr:hypothetical protein K488DRAFT_54332 [Vararia minispora EC-137]